MEVGISLLLKQASLSYDEILHKKRDKYLQSEKVQSFSLYNGTAIGDHDGTIDLHWDATNGAGAGASVIMGSRAQVDGWNLSTSIPVVDIAEVFAEHHITMNDYVVVSGFEV